MGDLSNVSKINVLNKGVLVVIRIKVKIRKGYLVKVLRY